MKALTCLLALVVAGLGSSASAQDAGFFKKLVGTWAFDSEAMIAPGQPKVKANGTETVQAVGSLWVTLESKFKVQGMSMHGIMTLGTTPVNKVYEGTYISSMTGALVLYKGTLSEDGKTLELMTEMADPASGKKTKMKDVISFQSDDRRTLKSFALDENGKWIEFLSASYRRVK